MIEQQIEELKNSIREIIRMIVERGEPLSEEVKIKLAQVIEHVTNRIQQLRQEQVGQEEQPLEAPITPTVPDMQSPYPSSNINGFNYDYDKKRLLVKFHGDKQADQGPVYAYEGVPRFIFDTFRKGAVAPKTSGKNRFHTWKKGVTPSLGAAMHHLIKNGGYQYNKLS